MSVGEVSEEKVVEDILESEPFMNQARSTRLSWQHLPTRVKGLFPGKKCLIGVFRLIYTAGGRVDWRFLDL